MAPAAVPMPTVSTQRPLAHWLMMRTVPSLTGTRVHIWLPPSTSSHNCSQVPLAVPAMARSITLPLARQWMR